MSKSDLLPTTIGNPLGPVFSFTCPRLKTKSSKQLTSYVDDIFVLIKYKDEIINLKTTFEKKLNAKFYVRTHS